MIYSTGLYDVRSHKNHFVSSLKNSSSIENIHFLFHDFTQMNDINSDSSKKIHELSTTEAVIAAV